jgi:hypothetical protein
MKPTTLFAFLFLMGMGLTYQTMAQDFDGYALYNPSGSGVAYLIDDQGDIAYTWSCDEAANYALALMPSGNIMRGAYNEFNQIEGPAVGGLVQEIDPDGEVVWEFMYSNPVHVSHHDIALMPNGNVLLIAWEMISEEDLWDMGFEDEDDHYATHIIEVQQDGTDGEIVWEWHILDHMIQDSDPDLASYGVISEHPELMDINVDADGFTFGDGPIDWFHVNGIDFNEGLDQIVFSSRFLNEIFIIDHSTTAEEAASHEGGNSGMGGDFLYRWGHPANYGADGPQVIPGPVHDARWIPEGRPNGGFIQVFNNEGNNGGSTVDAIDTPSNGYLYDLTPGSAYEPTSYSWRHECVDDASGQSASDRMSNGNVFVNLSGGFGGGGYMYEADEDDNVIWQYSNNSEKAFRYECDHPGLTALLGPDPCEPTTDIEEELVLPVTISPNPSEGVFNLMGEFNQNGPDMIRVFDLMGRELAQFSNALSFDLSDQPNGIYMVEISFEGKSNIRRVSVSR